MSLPEGMGQEKFLSSFFPVLVGVFIPSYFFSTFTTYGMIYLSWIYVIFSLCYAFKPILSSNWGCTPQWVMCSFCMYLQRPLLSSSVWTLGGPHEDLPLDRSRHIPAFPIALTSVSLVPCFFLLQGIKAGCGHQVIVSSLQQGLLALLSCLRALQRSCHIVKHLLVVGFFVKREHTWAWTWGKKHYYNFLWLMNKAMTA